MITINSKIKELLIKNINENKRSMFILVGCKAAENVPVMITLNGLCDERKRVLWCFKNETSYVRRRSRNNRISKKQKKRQEVSSNNYDNFVLAFEINWCHYNDSDSILGTTYDYCVLQDFESLTPNIMAKVIETVCGGGIIFFLLNKLTNLANLGALKMDAHNKFKTFNYNSVDFRFNYRLFYSLSQHASCIVLDEQLNMLPICEASLNVTMKDSNGIDKQKNELQIFKHKMAKEQNDIYKSIINLCATKDQVKALSKLVRFFLNNQVNETQQNGSVKCFKTSKMELKKLAVVTSGRGRGKSALLGLIIAYCVTLGFFKRVGIASPNAENVITLIQFIINGFNAIGYKENCDYYKIVGSNGQVEGINVQFNNNNNNNNGKGCIKYVCANTENVYLFSGFDMLCIDETAAIPLPIVTSIIDCTNAYCVLMSSTIHGYEGTGRSLSLKLICDMRKNSEKHNLKVGEFYETELKAPIRYGKNDCVEHWLNKLLCLDCEQLIDNQVTVNNLNNAKLYFVNRNLLFSGHPQTERVLQKIMAIYVSSHYKNTPNDLLMLADSSSHVLFCLADQKVTADETSPNIYAVVQLAFEGHVDSKTAQETLTKGLRPSGDMVSWTLSQQFNSAEFATLTGARIIRIAVHPNYQRQGLGSRCLQSVIEYFNTVIEPLNCNSDNTYNTMDQLVEMNPDTFQLKDLCHYPDICLLGPLFIDLKARKAEKLDYLSVSYGLTFELFRFWKRNGFSTVYIRQTKNESTGEHSCIMIRSLIHNVNEKSWLSTFFIEFSKRFLLLLSGSLRKLNPVLCLDILYKPPGVSSNKIILTEEELKYLISIPTDTDRIQCYLNNLIDYHTVIDLVPRLANIFFSRTVKSLKLPKIQSLILLGMGLQHKTVDELVADLTSSLPDMGISSNEILGHLREAFRSFQKAIKKLSTSTM